MFLVVAPFYSYEAFKKLALIGKVPLRSTGRPVILYALFVHNYLVHLIQSYYLAIIIMFLYSYSDHLFLVIICSIACDV